LTDYNNKMRVRILLFSSMILVQSIHIPPSSFLVATAQAQQVVQPRDGQRDFDFEIGTWTTKLSRRLKPLTGSSTWVEYTGTTTVRKVWDGRANLVELDVTGPSGRIEGLSLRLYNPESRQWSLNFSNTWEANWIAVDTRVSDDTGRRSSVTD